MTVSPGGGAGFSGKRTDTEEGRIPIGSREKAGVSHRAVQKKRQFVSCPFPITRSMIVVFSGGASRGGRKETRCSTGQKPGRDQGVPIGLFVWEFPLPYTLEFSDRHWATEREQVGVRVRWQRQYVRGNAGTGEKQLVQVREEYSHHGP